MQANGSTVYPYVGAASNLGIVNASSTAYPSAPPFCAVQSYSSGTLTVSNPTLPSGINATNGFPATGTLTVVGSSGTSPVTMTYTGISGNTFTGCSITSGSLGSFVPGQLSCWLSATGVGNGLANALVISSTAFVFPPPLATVQYVNVTTATTYSGVANYMAPGTYDGQMVTYVNVPNGNATLTFGRTASATTGYAQIALSAATLAISYFSSITFLYQKATNTWVEMASTAGTTVNT